MTYDRNYYHYGNADGEIYETVPVKTNCPKCDDDDEVCSNPNRENGPWYRCYKCGSLWDRDYNDLTDTCPLPSEYLR